MTTEHETIVFKVANSKEAKWFLNRIKKWKNKKIIITDFGLTQLNVRDKTTCFIYIESKEGEKRMNNEELNENEHYIRKDSVNIKIIKSDFSIKIILTDVENEVMQYIYDHLEEGLLDEYGIVLNLDINIDDTEIGWSSEPNCLEQIKIIIEELLDENDITVLWSESRNV